MSARPFHCGSQYADWQDRNCLRCTLYNPEQFDGACEIDEAMGMGYIGDGTVPDEIAVRMGYVEGVAFTADGIAYTWDCPERQLREV